nr:glycosyltransferase family 8 protein [Zhongshania aquimaris]
MHVACAANKGYLHYAAVMLSSLLLHNARSNISIHFLHDDSVNSLDLEKLSVIASRSKANFYSYNIDSHNYYQFPEIGRFGKLAWYRLFLAEILPSIQRVLYLDVDIIIRGSISDMWGMDLEGMPIAAVHNPIYPYMNRHFLRSICVEESEYFNSGVILMDLHHWREGNYGQRLIDCVRNSTELHLPDQNILNIVFKGLWKPLEPKWNAQNSIYEMKGSEMFFSPEALQEARESPVVVHFISHYKPDHYRCKHPFRGEFRRLLASLEWADSSVKGVSIENIVVRLFPESFGWRLEKKIAKYKRMLGIEI